MLYCVQMARNNFKNIQKEISTLLNQISNLSSMLRGSYGVAYRRCGKPNCKCAVEDSKAHPFFRLSWTDQGKQYTRTIPDDDQDWIKSQVENHKLFRKNKRKIMSLQKKLSDELTILEQKMIKETRKEREYLC